MKTYRGLTVIIGCLLWLVGNLLIWWKVDSLNVACNNFVWIGIFGILTILEYTNKKFRKWLLTPIKKSEKM